MQLYLGIVYSSSLRFSSLQLCSNGSTPLNNIAARAKIENIFKRQLLLDQWPDFKIIVGVRPFVHHVFVFWYLCGCISTLFIHYLFVFASTLQFNLDIVCSLSLRFCNCAVVSGHCLFILSSFLQLCSYIWILFVYPLFVFATVQLYFGIVCASYLRFCNCAVVFRHCVFIISSSFRTLVG